MSTTFDWSASHQAGYEATRQQLHDAVRAHCGPHRPAGGGHVLTDEDLAIGLYTVTRASFSLHEDPRRQWTVGHDAIIAMFESLHGQGITGRRCPDRHKSGAILRALEAARLVECQDRMYVPAGRRGISRKWTIGPAHPRYAEFCRFAETVRVIYVGAGKFECKRVYTRAPHLPHRHSNAHAREGRKSPETVGGE